MIWHLYDYYLQPGGGYFGAKKALRPINPVYGYDDHAIWLVSNQYSDAKGLKLAVRVFNQDASLKFSKEVTIEAPADSTAKVLMLPQIEGLSPTYFLDLRVTDESGKLVGSNFYWLSTKAETLNWKKSTWFMTPTSSYADYSSLAQLPKVELAVSSRTEIQGESAVTHVTLVNHSKSIAFFLRLKVAREGSDDEILPVIWEDNYFSLLPEEKREVTATYKAAAIGTNRLGQPDAVVKVKGWNVE